MNKFKFWLKKAFLLLILIYINLSCLFVWLIITLLWFYGLVSITFYHLSTTFIIINSIFLLLSVIYSFYINFRYFCERIYFSYQKEMDKKNNE